MLLGTPKSDIYLSRPIISMIRLRGTGQNCGTDSPFFLGFDYEIRADSRSLVMTQARRTREWTFLEKIAIFHEEKTI